MCGKVKRNMDQQDKKDSYKLFYNNKNLLKFCDKNFTTEICFITLNIFLHN